MGYNPLDWNRRGIQRLIIDAEDALSFLNGVLSNSDPAERAMAIRNGRLIYKEMVRRRKSYLLTPVSAKACEQLFDEIRGALRRLRRSLGDM